MTNLDSILKSKDITLLAKVLLVKAMSEWVKSLSRVQLFATPWTIAYRPLHPWDSPGKDTGVGWCFLLQVKAIVFPIVMYGCESWTIKKAWEPKNGCFWTVVLEETLESPLDSKEIQPVHLNGNQSWIFIGRTDDEAETPILWPPDTKTWPIWKDPDAGKDWRWEEKGMTEDEIVEWHHWLNGHEFE